ncbi:hypothetical protein LCGC14_2510450 [marine sediment metagenome]|uniref:Uncharacterized protein n=1 Tax=marine sediment metagenome TaxID=412755 RepID=A0A0F9DB21_9ZZZZ
MKRLFAASLAGPLLAAACTPTGGTIGLDANVNAPPVEQIARPSDGFANEISAK